MENDNAQRKSFKEKFLNKKVLLIAFIALIVIVCGGFVGVEKASDNPKFCTLCHNMQSYYDSWNKSDLLANKHATAGVKCHDCHESSIAVQAEEGFKYITGDYTTPLAKKDFATTQFCTKCHDLSKAKTETNFPGSNPHDSHIGELQCYTCHNVHQPSNVLCKQCHTFEWFKDLPSSWNAK